MRPGGKGVLEITTRRAGDSVHTGVISNMAPTLAPPLLVLTQPRGVHARNVRVEGREGLRRAPEERR